MLCSLLLGNGSHTCDTMLVANATIVLIALICNLTCDFMFMRFTQGRNIISGEAKVNPSNVLYSMIR